MHNLSTTKRFIHPLAGGRLIFCYGRSGQNAQFAQFELLLGLLPTEIWRHSRYADDENG